MSTPNMVAMSSLILALSLLMAFLMGWHKDIATSNAATHASTQVHDTASAFLIVGLAVYTIKTGIFDAAIRFLCVTHVSDYTGLHGVLFLGITLLPMLVAYRLGLAVLNTAGTLNGVWKWASSRVCRSSKQDPGQDFTPPQEG